MAGRIDQLQANDSVKNYLRQVQRERAQTMRGGHITATAAQMTKPIDSPLKTRVPIKKKRQRSSDSDDESAEEERPCEPSQSTTKPPPQNFLFSLFFNSIQQASSLPLAYSPSSSFVEQTRKCFLLSRERITSLRLGLEQLEHRRDEKEALDSLQRFMDYGGSKRRDDVARVVREIEARREKWADKLPQSPSFAMWSDYLDGLDGPLEEVAPPLSMFAFMDGAHTSVVTILLLEKLKAYARAQAHSSSTAIVDGVAEADDGDEPDRVTAGGLMINESDDDDVGLFRPNDCPQKFAATCTPKEVECLRFLRHLMPCSDGEGRSSQGFGVWLFCALASLDLPPLDPDTDREMHNFFRLLCTHIRTIGDWASQLPACEKSDNDERGWLMERFAPSSTPWREYWSMAEVDQGDIRALYTLLIVIGNNYKQNHNNLVALD